VLSITVLAITVIVPTQALAVNGPKWGQLEKTAGPTTTSLPFTMTDVNGVSSTKDKNVKTADILSLDSIRSTLIRQEETIIFAIIERAQFRQNLIVYEEGGFGDLGKPLGSSLYDESEGSLLSFLEFMLIGK